MALHEVLSALADETRRKILLKLKEGKINSGDLALALNMTPQALSYHLSKLKKADLIYETRYKNFIYYEINTIRQTESTTAYFNERFEFTGSLTSLGTISFTITYNPIHNSIHEMNWGYSDYEIPNYR